jgi:hypothetical protein
MTDDSSTRSLMSPSKLVAVLCGLVLVISIFLPWLTPSARLGTQFNNASALNVSVVLSIVGVLAGLLTIVIAWFPSPVVRRYLHIAVGLVAIGVLAIMLFNRTVPFLSPLVRSYVGIGAGVYLYVLSSAAIMITGLAERPKTEAEVRRQPISAAKNTIPDRTRVLSAENTATITNDATVVPARYCPACGTRTVAGSSFCVSCGKALTGSQIISPGIQASFQAPPRHVSGAWWLLPVFLGLLGGFIAWLAVRKDRPGMALGMLLLGFMLTAIPTAIAAVLAYLEG